MNVPMKVIDREMILRLNDSSIKSGRRQYLSAEQLTTYPRQQYIVNFRFDHEWDGGKDMRLSILLKPGTLTAWLDVSQAEFDAIPDVSMTELDWEAAVCVGTPQWVK